MIGNLSLPSQEASSRLLIGTTMLNSGSGSIAASRASPGRVLPAVPPKPNRLNLSSSSSGDGSSSAKCSVGVTAQSVSSQRVEKVGFDEWGNVFENGTNAKYYLWHRIE